MQKYNEMEDAALKEKVSKYNYGKSYQNANVGYNPNAGGAGQGNVSGGGEGQGLVYDEPIDSSGDDPTFGMNEDELRNYQATQNMPEGMDDEQFAEYERSRGSNKLKGLYNYGRKY